MTASLTLHSTVIRRVDPATDALRRALAEVPTGEYALLEAAIAWRNFRPAQTRPSRRSPARAQTPPTGLRYLPLAEVDDEQVAARLCRLLSELAFAVVTRPEPEPGTTRRRLRVEVPAPVFHLVVRALSGALRHARRELDADVAGAAAAIWRMGLLIGGLGPNRDAICLRTGGSGTADLLVGAAAVLGVSATVDEVRGDPAVLVCQAGDVRRLLNAAVTPALVR
ncbi:hypothetical protein R8Z50_14435 [Longispora sp. K20-0274]|uniref:hypothetical protein n=1 Tax=Longispora sp. K20-0274 TaxID=3088255 RepID=UPI00399BA388